MENIKNILLKIEEATNALTEYLNEIKQNNESLWHNVAIASKAYQEDADLRKEKVEEQIKALELQKKEILLKAEALRSDVVKAAASGNTEKIIHIQNEITALKAHESAIDTQIDFLYTTPIKGDDKLYDIAKNLNDDLEADNKNCKKAYSLYETAEKHISFWQKIKDGSFYNGGHYSTEFTKIKNLHNDGECVDRPHIDEGSQNLNKNIETSRVVVI